MKTMLRITLFAAMLSALATGCLHHRTMVACAPAAGESACWESARIDAEGQLEHHIVERVSEGGDCDQLVVEQTSFEHGKVIQRVKDRRSCGVVEHRITDRYEASTGRLHREVAEDLDRDDRFDTLKTYEVAMSSAQRVFAATTGWQRMVRLQERLDEQSPRSMMAAQR